jgi:ATP-dependent DNA helicase RecG
MSLQDEVVELVGQARMAGTDSVAIEIKKAAGGAPKGLPETVSAFSNGGGGLIVLGVDEQAGFVPVPIQPQALADALAGACADSVEPAVRAHIEVVDLEGMPVVAAVIPPMNAKMRPCYVKTQGMERGSYIRAHDGDRHLTTYEVHLLVSGRGQPRDDAEPVEGATTGDLDQTALERLVTRLRDRRGPAFERADQADILRMAGVSPRGGAPGQVTLAGLFALGRYPQEFFPQLNVTFVSYPTVSGRMMADGTRFLENASLDGSIPDMVAGLVDVVTRHMTRRSVMVGIGREDRWEYPVEAVRELAVNALMHRDYHPLSQGMQVRVEMYPDRLVFSNPGGVFGAAAPAQLLEGSVYSSRNAVLARLLEDVELPRTTRTVCENRGSGLKSVAEELGAAGLQPARFHLSVGLFTVELRNGLRNAETAAPTPATALAVAEAATSEARLLAALATGPKTTAELVKATGLSRSGVGAKLRTLEQRGQVEPVGNRYSPRVRWAPVLPV